MRYVFLVAAVSLAGCARFDAAHQCLVDNPRSDQAVFNTLAFGPVGGAISGMDADRNARVHMCLVQHGVVTADN